MDVIIEHRSLCMEPELVIDYSDYEHRLRAIEERGWITKNGRHILIGDEGCSSGGAGRKFGKNIDKSGKSDKMNYEDSSSKRIRITQKAIDSVPDVAAFSSDELNQLVTDKCREILADLKSDAVGTEETVSIKIISLESEKRKGGQGEGVVKGISFDEPYISIHNHPSGESFSGRDIDKFAYDKNHKAMCVVGNNGKIYVLQKQSAYNWVEFAIKTFELQNKDNYAEKVLKGAEKYGFEYYKG